MSEQIRKENQRTVTKQEAAEIVERGQANQEQDARERVLGKVAAAKEVEADIEAILDEIDQDPLFEETRAARLIKLNVQGGGQ